MRRKRRFLTAVVLLVSLAAVPVGSGQVRAQADAAGGNNEAAVERLRERAERVQERRRARVTQEQREAAAERAKAAREKAAVQKGSAAEEVPARDEKEAAK